VLWGKNCTSYKCWKLGGFPKYHRNCLEYCDQALHTDRYYGEAGDGSQEFITFCIDAVWERGKDYGFLLSFHTVDFVLALHAAAKRMWKFCVKIWLWNSKRLWRKWRLYFDFGYFILKVWNFQMEPEVPALPIVNNFVAWEEQIIMLKTGSKSIPKWQSYNRLKLVRYASEFERSGDWQLDSSPNQMWSGNK